MPGRWISGYEQISVHCPAYRSFHVSTGTNRTSRIDLNLVKGHQMTEPKIVKVLIGIPNMGYAHSEAYGNRLINFMQMGNLQTEQRTFHILRRMIEKNHPELADQVSDEFKNVHSQYMKNSTEEVFQFFFLNVGRIFTPAAREECAKWSISGEMDYLFMIDDDMIVPDDLFLKLYKHHNTADIVCPLAFTRNPPHNPVIYSSIEGWDAVHKKDYFKNTIVMNYPKDQLVRVDASGFGAVLMKTWMFKELEPPYFMSSEGTGEDILWCYKSKKVGAKVYVDTSIKLGHLGSPINVTEEYVEEYRKKDPLSQKRYAPYSKEYMEDKKAVTVVG